MESNFYYALGHDLRRKIIKIIGDNEVSSFTHLKRELRVSTGTIYHHLDTLSQLIAQGENKKYYLTDLGHHAYESLQNNIENIISPDFSTKEFRSPILKGLMFVTPKRFINYAGSYRIYTIIISIGILILGLLLSNLNNLSPLFLFFTDLFYSIQGGNLIGQIFLNTFFILNFLFYYFINEIICRLFYKKKENSIKFLLSFDIIFYPNIIYLGIHYLFNIFELLDYSLISILDYILMILFQVLSLWLLTFNLIVNKHLKVENALIISLLIHYGGFSIILALSI